MLSGDLTECLGSSMLMINEGKWSEHKIEISVSLRHSCTNQQKHSKSIPFPLYPYAFVKAQWPHV